MDSGGALSVGAQVFVGHTPILKTTLQHINVPGEIVPKENRLGNFYTNIE